MAGDWRKFRNKEHHNLYSWPSIVRMTKSRRMKWAGHLVCMGRREMHVGYWWKSQEEGDQYEDQETVSLIILKWIL
jgi:hypothetical protein